MGCAHKQGIKHEDGNRESPEITKNIAHRVLDLFYNQTVVSFSDMERLGLKQRDVVKILVLLLEEKLLRMHTLGPEMSPESPGQFFLTEKGREFIVTTIRLKYVSGRISVSD